MSLPSCTDYEALIYSLPHSNPEQIQASTLRLYSTSAQTARVVGEIRFRNGLVLQIREFLDFKARQIRDYSYTIYHGEQKIRWYDPQPHPHDPALAATFPHHYHEEPGIKLNRRPAPGITFDSPNLPRLIEDCLRLGGE
ncbi:MAG: DUF6516 family protein [Anaerolineales bacterium]|nr:DUF6516 family protein [Anaerolineales bacterium]